jgi:hypothetical protein
MAFGSIAAAPVLTWSLGPVVCGTCWLDLLHDVVALFLQAARLYDSLMFTGNLVQLAITCVLLGTVQAHCAPLARAGGLWSTDQLQFAETL